MNPISSRNGTNYSSESVMAQLTLRKASLDRSQQEIATGKRINNASDDPVGAAQAERAMTRIERIKIEQRAMDMQRSNMTLAESSLGEGIEYLQRSRELVIAARNGGLDLSQRTSIANEIQSLRNRLLQLANRQDSNGMALFGGLGSVASPFAEDALGAVSFVGVAGIAATSDVSLPMALDGQSAFMFASATSPSSSIFNAMDATIAALKQSPTTVTALNSAITQGLTDIDTGLTQLNSARGQAGEYLNQSDRIENLLNTRNDQAETDRSRVQDLDMAEGISKMQSNQTAYEIALKSYAQLQQMSLFNFLN
jgi:flagellar hook-associated protein 3 FlgL